MDDIHQWRLKIHPVKSRRASTDPEEESSAPTKRSLRPVLSSYFTQYAPPSVSKKFITTSRSSSDIFGAYVGQAWQEAQVQHASPPNADILVDRITVYLMDDPYQALDPRFNSMILRIFEGYRDLRDEKTQLEAQVRDRSHSYKSSLLRLQDAQEHWFEERQEYKGEIRRLELLLAQGKRGLAEVTIARQNSVLRQKQARVKALGGKDDLETVFEVLEKAQREDSVYAAQRATFRQRLPSPSAGMRRLSRQLTTKQSMTSIHADLPFGTPPGITAPMSLSARAQQDDRRTASVDSHCTDQSRSDAKTNFSEDSYSEYSCAGDLPRNEVSDGTLVGTTAEDDMTMIKRIAETVAHRRNINIAELTPKLLDLFEPTPNASLLLQDTRSMRRIEARQSSMPKHMQIGSGLVKNKLKLQHPSTSTYELRRFSFEFGDDTASLMNLASPVNRLRKSVSMCSLPSPGLYGGHDQETISPQVAPSPTTSTRTADSRRVSRIPTPVCGNGSIARPRQERDDSATSLLTVIKRSQDGSRAGGSISSPPLTPLTRSSFQEEAKTKEALYEKAKRQDPRRRVTSASGPSMRAPVVVPVDGKRETARSAMPQPDGAQSTDENCRPPVA